MNTDNKDFTYFQNILDCEVDSSLLFDSVQGQSGEFEFVKSLSAGLSGKVLSFSEKLSVDCDKFLIACAAVLFEKYSNSNKSLCVASYGKNAYPVCTGSKQTPDIKDYIFCMAKQLEKFKCIDVPLLELCEEFSLSAMPFITCDDDFYNHFSLSDFTTMKVKMLFAVIFDGNEFKVKIKYDGASYYESTVNRLASSFDALLEQITNGQSEISKLSLLDKSLTAELDSFNNTEKAIDRSQSIIDMFNKSVELYPDNTALVFLDKSFTYKELDELSNRIAAHLVNMNIKSEDVVSILIPRCEYMATASLGVLKSGAAYQPLDPSYPTQRLDFMIKDANAKLLITDRELIKKVPDYKGDVLYIDEIEKLSHAEKPSVIPKPENLFIMLYTSGSTGTPKGVMLEHRNLVAFCNWFHEQYNLTSDSRVAAYASYGFDADMMDMYPALTAGAQVHIIDENIRLDLLAIKKYFYDNKITHSFMTTQVGRQYADLFPDADYPNYLMVGGETLVPVTPPSKYKFYNIYGPTECTINVTAHEVLKLYGRVPIGKAVYNTKTYIVDEFCNRVPVGVAGELLISGYQVSRGYLNRPQQNEKAFIKNPFSQQTGYERAYRTGDIVRYLPDGSIDFVGRNDGQVKIRGFRIELSEVEAIIRKYEGIKDATVQAFSEKGGGKYIAAYIVSDDEIDIKALNDFILENKPPYMVPAVVMQIDKIPLNQNQKVNKKALPEPIKAAKQITNPENENQQKILECLSQVVGYDEIGIDSDIFDAGLTSIGSIKFTVLLYDRLNVSISTKALRQNNTIKKLDEYISSADKASQKEIRDKYPLTQTQKGIYVECMLNTDSVLYNLPCMLKLDKSISPNILAQALKTAVDAHPAVKCSIRADESGEIFMYPHDDRCVEVEMLSGSEEELESFFKGFARPFDFENGPLFRLAIFETDKHNYILFDFHHIISDGSSLAVLTKQIDSVLKGEALSTESYTQFDIALDEEKAFNSDEHKAAEKYYKETFDGITACTTPDRDVYNQTQHCGIFKTFDNTLDYDKIQKFCDENKITQNVFFTGVMGFVLGKYAHTDDVCFTTVYNGRNDVRTSDMMGMLVKTLPVRCQTDDSVTIKSLTSKLKSQLLSSMDNDIFSFAEISRAFNISANIMFVYQGDDFVEFEVGNQKTVLVEGVSDKAKADISINIFVENKRYRYEFEYRTDLYSEEFIKRLYDILVQSAKSFLSARTLGDVNITSKKQFDIIESFNNTDYPVDIMSVNRLFENNVRKNPDKLAVVTRSEKLTYKELNEKANKVANALIEKSVCADTVIGLVLNRSPYVYISEHGILKAGGAFLPMVPEYPDDRIDYCLKDSEAPFVITTEKIKSQREALFENKPYKVLTVEELLQSDNDTNPNIDIPLSSLAYCIYTSGSTGTPKGVMIEHRNLCNFVNSNPKNCEITNYTDNGEVSLALAAITFDVSVMEHFIPLSNSMTICMADEDEIHNPVMLADLILKNNVDIMKCTPSFMTNIIEIEQMHPALRRIKAFDIGAEAFPSTLYGKMRKVNPFAQIVNSYGPTECTVSCTTKVLNGYDDITIGGPLANMKIYVVNKQNSILPVGISGELIICGDGVGRGYVNLPEKNKESFFKFRGMNAYHSGDLVRWTQNGEIDFLGRIDNQVKLRGLRIELDGIENAINSFGGVRMSKVVVKNNSNEEYLAAYFTADTAVDINALTEYLKSKLTYYMVPNAIMQLDKMPLTVNGKIDKHKLPEIEFVKEEKEYVAPQNETEKEFCDKFAEILSLDQVSADANFFEIGGTSLSATKIAMFAINKGYQLVYKDIFENPTPQKLAKLLTKSQDTHEDKSFIKEYDYKAINKLLENNCDKNLTKVKKGELGNIILTGATGFLGIHVLKNFLINSKGTAYCMVRKGRYESCEKRLMSMLMYYFDTTFADEFANGRIICVDSDITDSEKVMELSKLDSDIIINCAACVKHFVKDDTLDKINVEGVKNIISMCEKSGKRMVQISTTSVAGEGNAQTVPFSKLMRENEIYFGQIIENDYIRTKFLAERAILESVAEGKLSAKIIRVGNLMSRRSDGEFQINFATNGFMRTLNAYRILGKFPMGSMNLSAEFSPIDSTANAILELAASNCDFTVFNSFNNHKIFMSDVIYAMKLYGFNIETVEDDVFAQALKFAAADDKMSDAVLGLIAYDSDDKLPRYEIMSDNELTTQVLYRLGFKWPIIDDEYLLNAIKSLDTLEFFE